MKRQVYNPFLPLWEYIPDGEPHVFGDRVYLYGSHDKEGGETFCMLDYTVWSAPVNDLTDWRCEGVSYRASQDPDYPNRKFMYAPDVVQGADGRYYLYYAMSGDFGVGGYHGPISVAVGDTPAGPFRYLGFVRFPDGTPMLRYVCFDPAVLNDNGTIRLYYGTQYDFEERADFGEDLLKAECEMFGKSADEITGTPESVMGVNMLVLQSDMLTAAADPVRIIPYKVKGTSFEGHPFFEAASMRKVGEKYYFVYSSQKNHELCYAVSDFPDKGFTFGGTIVSNGDVGFEGRSDADRLNMTGTTHGSIVEIGGKWYVFYHRLTHKSDYSRQACAEEIRILPDGSIPQVCITSCGLNGGALVAEGEYPAPIACHITNGRMPHGSNKIYDDAFPHVTHEGKSGDASNETVRFIAQIADGTHIGYKYFAFQGGERLTLVCKSTGEGQFVITDESGILGEIPLIPCKDWTPFTAPLNVTQGEHPLYLRYEGEGEVSLRTVAF